MSRGADGFAELYFQTYGRLCGHLYAYLGDAASAEDLVQEAFLRAWRDWPKVSRYDEPAAWVNRVAWNLATSRHRRLVVAARHLRRNRDEATVPPVGPEHVALVVALRTLSDSQRRVIVLHYLADQSVADISAVLDVPRGTVLSWLHRGRARLATQLSDAPIRATDPEVADHG
jgi:RNA polymerase sigma-70 factor (ECF subfamily)